MASFLSCCTIKKTISAAIRTCNSLRTYIPLYWQQLLHVLWQQSERANQDMIRDFRTGRRAAEKNRTDARGGGRRNVRHLNLSKLILNARACCCCCCRYCSFSSSSSSSSSSRVILNDWIRS